MSQVQNTILVGDVAPDFSLLDEQGLTHTLSDYRGKKHVVLIFYPKDFTPGCVEQLCAVRDDFAGFVERQAVVLGVNLGDALEHQAFRAQYKLQNPLLIDTDRSVAHRYNAIGSFFGNETTKRTVVVVDQQGIIRYYQSGMPKNKDIFEVLDTLEQERKSS